MSVLGSGATLGIATAFKVTTVAAPSTADVKPTGHQSIGCLLGKWAG
jgi:hypothetical protein